MKVYIPLAISEFGTQKLSRFVRESIKQQTVECEIIECVTPGEFNSQGNYSTLRCEGEAESRNLVRKMAIESGEEFCFIQDKDIALGREVSGEFVFENFVYYELLKILKSDESIGMVGCKKKCGKVVDVGCCAWRVKAIPEMQPAKNNCPCLILNNGVEALGYKCIFDSNQIITEM